MIRIVNPYRYDNVCKSCGESRKQCQNKTVKTIYIGASLNDKDKFISVCLCEKCMLELVEKINALKENGMGMTIDDSCERAPMSREEIVEILKTMVFGAQAFERFNAKEREALDYAISSLKTDEAYQLMYEGKEVYTKDEVIVMLMGLEGEIDDESWTVEWPDGSDETMVEMNSVDNIINQKIDKLKETK